MEPRSGIIIWQNSLPPAPDPARTHPPTAKLFLSMLCGVPTPILPPINKVCAPIFSKKKPWVFTIPRTVTHQSKDGHPAEGSIVQTQSIIATLGSILDSQLSWESGKFQLARWSHEVVIFSDRTVRPSDRPPGHPTIWMFDWLQSWYLSGVLFIKLTDTLKWNVRCPPPLCF